MEQVEVFNLNSTITTTLDVMTEYTRIILIGEKKKNEKYIFKVEYTDRHYSPNTKYVFYYPKDQEIEFTDENDVIMPDKLKTRIQYEIYKYFQTKEKEE